MSRTKIINNPYNKFCDSEYGQNFDILHIELWFGEKLPLNYTWYGLGQEVLRYEYSELLTAVEKFGWIVSEDDWQAGEYGKFSYGTNETTFRFPLIREGDVLAFTNGTAGKNGMKIEPELPNINGTIGSRIGFNHNDTGAFKYNGWTGCGRHQSGDQTWQGSITFDASRSSAIYKTSGTVKQSGILGRLIIKFR